MSFSIDFVGGNRTLKSIKYTRVTHKIHISIMCIGIQVYQLYMTKEIVDKKINKSQYTDEK